MFDQEFFDAYVACALWSSHDESDESGGLPMDYNYSSDDIAPESLDDMRADCERFCTENADLLAQACERDGYAMGRAGHDFWLTRNGHGAGFWDRDELEEGSIGEKLTAAVKAFGNVDLYVGDDGKIYQS